MSLFLRIFLSFWLAAMLLAGSFYLLGRYSGAEAIQRSKAVLDGQAEIVASLLIKDGRHATVQWLSTLTLSERPHLVDEQGRNPLRRGPQFNRVIPMKPIQQGVHALPSGDVLIVVPLPGVSPPLFLFQHLEQYRIQRIPVLLQFILALLVISLISYALASVLTRRIRKLRSTAQVIAAGDLSARVALDGNDEVSALAADFNRMTERIGDMLNSQRQLVRDVSHELRSPLARLRIALELAQKSGNLAVSLPRIEKEADELENLVTSLLSLARLESGQSQLEKQTVSLRSLVTQIVEDANYEGCASQRHVKMAQCDDADLIADPVMLRSAIENVVRNALRYTPQNSEVTIQLKRHTGSVTLCVDDQGKGVPMQELEKLFEPFARVSQARDRRSGGYGLGLAITGKIIQAHSGQVRAENRKAGGLRVIMTLPISPGAIYHAQAQPLQSSAVDNQANISPSS